MRLASTSIVFYSGRIRTLVAMATYILHRLIIGKAEFDIFSVSTGIFEFVNRNVY